MNEMSLELNSDLAGYLREVKSLRHACPLCHAPAGKRCHRVVLLPGTFFIRRRLRHPHEQRTALVLPVWRKGDKDPVAGSPLRHPRAKALLLLSGASPDVMTAALLALTDRDPLPVLTALADAIEAQEEEEGR
jgi:hypothetical protein